MEVVDVQRSRAESQRVARWLVASLLGPFALAAACIPFRSSLARTNLALVLVVTVMPGGIISFIRRIRGHIVVVDALLPVPEPEPNALAAAAQHTSSAEEIGGISTKQPRGQAI